MRNLLLICFSLCLAGLSQAWAQTRPVSGRVLDGDSDQGLPGVTVVAKGTPYGTSTDGTGNFSLDVPTTVNTLTFSFIGYTTMDQVIGESGVVNVRLRQDARMLNEVQIVLPYQTVDQRAITGSVSAIGATTIAKQQVTSVARALQGTTAGTQILTGIGQPGENPTIRIRGINSVNASAAPLIVLDGVPYGGNINSINPADIESMTVLKDAASAALYGSRAANGVLMITTKQGRAGEPRFDINVTQGFSTRTRPEYTMLGAAEYMQTYWEALRNYGAANNVANPGAYASNNLITNLRYNPYSVARPIDDNGNLVPGAELLWDTDWQQELTRTMSETQRREAQLSASGGTDRSRYFISFGYLKDQGISIHSAFDRLSGRLNFQTKLTDWLNIGTNLNIAYSDQNYPTQSGGSFSNIVQFYRSVPNIYPLHMRGQTGELLLDPNGEPQLDWGGNQPGRTVNVGRPVMQNENPIGTYLLNDNRYQRFTTTANSFAEFTLLPSVKFRSTFGIDLYGLTTREYSNPDFGVGVSVNGRARRGKDNTTQWTWSNQLSYNTTFGDRHNVNAFVVHEAFRYNFDYFQASVTGFPFGGLRELTSGANNESTSTYINEETLQSYLGKVGYNFDYRYFLDFSYRRDGSSRFAEDVRWGDFYAISGAWDIAQEAFLRQGNFVNQLKFRASYGEMGNNQTINNDGVSTFFPYLSQYETGNNILDNPGIVLTSLPNYNLTWEKSNTLNFGLDFGIFNNRLAATVDVYRKTTEGLLFNRPLPRSGGITTITENIGALKNEGIEVSLTSQNIRTDNFLWTTTINVSRNRNQITRLPNENAGINIGSRRLEVGKSVYEFYLEEWAGVNPQTGQAQWYRAVTDAEGNETREITTNYSQAASGRIFVGSALPDFVGGITNDIVFRNFDLSFNFYGSFGGHIFDSDYSGLMQNFRSPGNQSSTDIRNRWRNPGDITDVPQIGVSQDANARSTRFLYDASFGRLRFLNMGYNLPAPLTQRIHLSRARIFLQGDNLLTFYHRPGLEPEQSITGTTNNRSALMRTVSVGFNIGF